MYTVQRSDSNDDETGSIHMRDTVIQSITLINVGCEVL